MFTSTRESVPFATNRECTQHRGMVPSSDKGEFVVSPDRMHRRYVCASCAQRNTNKLAALFGVDELTEA